MYISCTHLLCKNVTFSWWNKTKFWVLVLQKAEIGQIQKNKSHRKKLLAQKKTNQYICVPEYKYLNFIQIQKYFWIKRMRTKCSRLNSNYDYKINQTQETATFDVFTPHRVRVSSLQIKGRIWLFAIFKQPNLREIISGSEWVVTNKFAKASSTSYICLCP